MAKFYLLAALFLASFSSFGACPTGSQNFTTQSAFETYMAGYSSCTVFDGDLSVSGITSLAPLANYTQITGQLFLTTTPLANLAGLEKITSVGKLLVQSNPNLTTLDALENLESVGSMLSIWNNAILTDISALAGIESFSSVTIDISENYQLADCAILSICNNLTDFESAMIVDNNTGCASYDEIEDACIASLPVTLADFNVKKENSRGLLSWNTTSEVNSSHFTIQQSATGRVWRDLGTVTSKGSGNYSFTDSQPWDGNNYYRLKMIDLDGTFAYSRIRNLHFDFDMAVYPNPVSDRLLIKNTDWASIKHFQLYNSTGRVVVESKKVQPAGIDLTRFASGVYTARLIHNNGSVKTLRIIKD